MLGNAKPYFTLIAQSPNRVEVEAAAAAYEKLNPKMRVIIDRWKDYLDDTPGLWRARVWLTVERSRWQRFLYTLGR
ncbi:MAG: hypothetical protein FD167_3140 [bacterium]|nr:MAG: hypothetical protein FD167_3140 [bacterium]